MRKFQLYRRMHGGIWVEDDVLGWLKAKESYVEGYLRDETGRSYHVTLRSILNIESYPNRGLPWYVKYPLIGLLTVPLLPVLIPLLLIGIIGAIVCDVFKGEYL